MTAPDLVGFVMSSLLPYSINENACEHVEFSSVLVSFICSNLTSAWFLRYYFAKPLVVNREGCAPFFSTRQRARLACYMSNGLTCGRVPFV